MRTFLHKLMVDITRQPREIIKPVWSKSVVVNAFRLYEYWFGRRAGIRFEGGNYDGITVHGTWENFLAHWEGKLRSFELGFKIVPLPVMVTSDGTKVPMKSIFNFAIAYDNAITYFNGENNVAFTVTGANPTLLTRTAGGSAHTCTALTYAGVSMLPFDQNNVEVYRFMDAHLLAPATGSNTYSYTWSASDGSYGTAIASYSGTNQTAIDAVTFSGYTGGNMTATVNTATANCWGVVFGCVTNGTQTAGTNTTLRSSARGDIFAGDSNGTISTGSFSMTINWNQVSGQGGGISMYKIAPTASATVNSGFFFAAAS